MVQEMLLVLQELQSSGKLKSMDSKAMVKAIEGNLESSSLRVLGKLGISQSIHHLHKFGKSIHSCCIVPYITKIYQNFWLLSVSVMLSSIPDHRQSFLIQFSMQLIYFFKYLV